MWCLLTNKDFILRFKYASENCVHMFVVLVLNQHYLGVKLNTLILSVVFDEF